VWCGVVWCGRAGRGGSGRFARPRPRGAMGRDGGGVV
jgi:hypothetical protein